MGTGSSPTRSCILHNQSPFALSCRQIDITCLPRIALSWARRRSILITPDFRQLAMIFGHMFQKGNRPRAAVDLVVRILVPGAALHGLGRSRENLFQCPAHIRCDTVAVGVYVDDFGRIVIRGRELDIYPNPVTSMDVYRHDHLCLALCKSFRFRIVQICRESSAAEKVGVHAVEDVGIRPAPQIVPQKEVDPVVRVELVPPDLPRDSGLCRAASGRR